MSQTSMKTPKGTELPFFMIERRSKDKITGQWKIMPPQPYLQVAHRLVWFREEHPDWCIESLIVDSSKTHTICKAVIKSASGSVIAMAHKQENAEHFGDHLEKAETGAIGRALALCGYGTQFAPEFDEEDRIVDSPIKPKISSESHGVDTIERQRIQSTLPVGKTSSGDYIIRIGKKYAGRSLNEIASDPSQGIKALRSFADYLENNSRDQGKPLNGGGLECFNAIHDFLSGAAQKSASITQNLNMFSDEPGSSG